MATNPETIALTLSLTLKGRRHRIYFKIVF